MSRGRGPLAEAERFRPGDVRLGYVAGVFGLAGEVRLFLYNRDSTLFERGADVVLVAPDGSRRVVTLRARPGAGKRILGRLVGVDTPEAAGALAQHEIVVDREALPDTGPGEYYHRDLIGLAVRTATGVAVGRLAEIHSTGDVDTWVVRSGRSETYLPALARVVLGVDLDQGVITVADDAVGTI